MWRKTWSDELCYAMNMELDINSWWCDSSHHRFIRWFNISSAKSIRRGYAVCCFLHSKLAKFCSWSFFFFFNYLHKHGRSQWLRDWKLIFRLVWIQREGERDPTQPLQWRRQVLWSWQGHLCVSFLLWQESAIMESSRVATAREWEIS